jgi:hypothetical protein
MAAGLGGALSGAALFDPKGELLALAPRIAVGLAAAAFFAWLEVGRQGALAALSADAEGLIELPEEEPPRGPVPSVLQRPEVVVEAVLEAEPVVEALPAPEDDKK